MEWKNEYSVGILEIDDQHKLLLRSFTEIEESIRLGEGWSNTHYAILELNQLARMHFTFEEAIMHLFGYPETEAHQNRTSALLFQDGQHRKTLAEKIRRSRNGPVSERLADFAHTRK